MPTSCRRDSSVSHPFEPPYRTPVPCQREEPTMPQAVHRTPRSHPAGPTLTQFELPPLPTLEPPAKLQPFQLVLPVLGSLSILVYGVMAGTPVLLVTGGIMALASLSSPVVLHRAGRRAQRATLAERRRRYRARLCDLDAAVTAAGAQAKLMLADP